MLLSYVKTGTVSTHAFQRTTLSNITGDSLQPLYFYFDANVEYLRGPHLPIAILAGINLVVIILPLPFLLMLYQFRFFRKCLTCCCSNGFKEGLRTFMEAFQGYYRDGSDGGHDYRYFSCIYIFLRMLSLNFVLPNISFSVFDYSYDDTIYSNRNDIWNSSSIQAEYL